MRNGTQGRRQKLAGTVALRGASLMLMWIFVALAPALNAQGHPTGDPSIVAPDARLETIFADGINTEGPAVAPDGSVFFVDLPAVTTVPRPAGRIWRWNPSTGQATIYRSPSNMAAGIEFDAEGRMVVAEMSFFGGRRITRTDLRTGESEIRAALYQGKPLGGLNDLAIDEKGRVYVTEYDAIAPHEILYQRTPGVYRLDPDGTIERILQNSGLANGIAISPDQRTLYLGATRFDMLGNRAVLAYDLLPDGKVSFRSVLVRYPAEANSQIPDGMAVDVEGNLWVAIYSRGGRTGVAVYSPEGSERAFIATPEPAKNVAFGRDGARNLLYITAGRSLYRLAVNKQGYDLPRAPTLVGRTAVVPR